MIETKNDKEVENQMLHGRHSNLPNSRKVCGTKINIKSVNLIKEIIKYINI